MIEEAFCHDCLDSITSTSTVSLSTSTTNPFACQNNSDQLGRGVDPTQVENG